MSRRRPAANRPPRHAAAGRRSAAPGSRGRSAGRLVVLIATVAVVGGGLAAWGVWWQARSQPPGRGRGCNVVLITFDTARADHFGCYGCPAAPTPNVDRLAATGTRFAQCTSAVPSTLASHATILTGAYPYVHGVRHNVGYRLAESNVTLAEVLRREGYGTAAFVAAYVVNRDTGLDQGFETYDDAGERHERRADEVCDRALDWLRQHTERKFFLWLHFFDPHFPYEPPEPFRSQYAQPYDGEIAFADAQVGRLMDALRRAGLEERTLVVVTADHGEGLGQHDEKTHIFFVYDTTMSVPLILHGPGIVPAGTVVPQQMRTADIAPTILAYLGLAPDAALPSAQGKSLIPHIQRAHDVQDLPAYGETLGGQIALGTAALRCLRTGGWKYIHAPRPELYNVRLDPGETRNLAAEAPQRVAAMRAQLRTLLADAPSAMSPQDATAYPDERSLARLQGLGYVGGGPDAATEAAEELDCFDATDRDPKDHAADFAAVGQAMHLLQIGQPAAAEAIYAELRRRLPNVVELGLQHARAVFLQGRFEDAIGIYRALLRKHADNARVHYGLAKLLGRTGRQAEAIEHFVVAVRLDPANPVAHYDLGVALDKAGRRSEALECYRAALAARPAYVDARVNLAVGLAAAGRTDEALAQYDAALRTAPGDATIHYNRGNVLLRAGRLAEAIAAYQEALRLKPDFAAAREALRFARRQQANRGTPP